MKKTRILFPILFSFCLMLIFTSCDNTIELKPTKVGEYSKLDLGIFVENKQRLINLGQSKAEIDRILGHTTKTGELGAYKYNGIDISFDRESKVESIEFETNLEGYVNFSTYRKIKLDSPFDNVIKSYGTPSYESSSELKYIFSMDGEQVKLLGKHQAEREAKFKKNNLYMLSFLRGFEDEEITFISLGKFKG